MDRSRLRVWLPAALLLTACSGSGTGQAPEAKTPAAATPISRQDSPPLMQNAASVFADMEEGLLALPELALSADLKAEGALAASLEAKLRVSKQAADFAIKGTFTGQTVDTQLSANDDKLTIGKGRPLTRPAALHEAMVLGFSRMGLMHNAARLTGSGIPDHADGGVRTWLETKDHAFAPDVELDGVKAQVITYVIFVNGERSADATVSIDPQTLRPLERSVVVHFPQGDMRVSERYRYES